MLTWLKRLWIVRKQRSLLAKSKQRTHECVESFNMNVLCCAQHRLGDSQKHQNKSVIDNAVSFPQSLRRKRTQLVNIEYCACPLEMCRAKQQVYINSLRVIVSKNVVKIPKIHINALYCKHAATLEILWWAGIKSKSVCCERKGFIHFE